MSLDFSTLMAGMMVSGVGFILFRYGKKMSRTPHWVAGMVLMIGPYFVPGVTWILIASVSILFLLWLATRMGY